MSQINLIPVTLLQRGDQFYPVNQALSERSDELCCVIDWPKIDRNTGSIIVSTIDKKVNYLPTAVVARVES